jgi:hypothetical protein
MDNYQAVYDAVRSRISNGDIGAAVADVARQSFDVSHVIIECQDAVQTVRREMTRPSVLYRPRIFIDGNKWCALYGDNLQDGIAGFGSSPECAFVAFDAAWLLSLDDAQAAIAEGK